MSAIKFVKSSVSGKLIRPQGYAYPAGLSFGVAGTLSVDYLIVAGGGSGNDGYINALEVTGGGGGAGGMLTGRTTLNTAQNYTITVGAGGTYTRADDTSPGGSNSVFGVVGTAIGGGGGGKQSRVGGNGGSGGGGGGNNNTAGGTGTAGPPRQGYDGSAGAAGQGNAAAGGGGGAGGAGGLPTAGVGLANTITGASVTYAAGGTGGTPGSGSGSAGTANRGNGGNGAGNGTGLSGGNGGSGIVIISYIGSQAAVGGTVTTASGNTIHTFTGDGTFTANNTSYFVN